LGGLGEKRQEYRVGEDATMASYIRQKETKKATKGFS